MANALGVLQALIKQKRKEETEQALKARVINTGAIRRFDSVVTHHDYNALSGIEKTMFLEFASETATEYMHTKSGKPRLVYSKKSLAGVGINDAPYQVHMNLLGTRVKCPAYYTWSNMIKRCYSDKECLKYPTYMGCTVAPEWHSFMHFRDWWLQHYKDGYQLDKDLLVVGNKVYSPDTCIFVPQWLNMLTVASSAARGVLPIGVSLSCINRTKPYQARCSDGAGTQVHLGFYDAPEEAHQAWLNYKLSIVDARSTELEAIRAGLADKVKAKVLSLV